MARKGRKQLAVQIKEESFTALEKIKEETGLSNAKIIEMLIENYQSTNISTSTNTSITEEQLRKIIKEELSCINTNTNINTKPKSQPKPKQKQPVLPVEDDDEYVPFTESIVDIPDFQKKEIDPQAFYGKIPEKKEYALDPDDEFDRMMLDAGMK